MPEPARTADTVTVTVNRARHRLCAPVSIAGFLHSAGYSADAVSVSVRGRIVRRADWHDYALTEGLELCAISLKPGAVQSRTPDPWQLGEHELESRLMFAIPENADLTYLAAVTQASGIQSATIKASPETPDVLRDVVDLLLDQGVRILPHTSGCQDARAAVVAARHGGDIVGARWVQLIVTADDAPDAGGLIAAAEQLVEDGFHVYPRILADPDVAADLVAIGCAGLVLEGSPSGSGRGITDLDRFAAVLNRVEVPVILGAGTGTAAHACQAMEMGCAAVASTVVFRAPDQAGAAVALAHAIAAGRAAYLAQQQRRRP
ncbi:beta/alpha barrel domain-containing protein [Nocardia goodfellowii]|uniref:thiazole synthase n=1 Tax=Nocardia goodfellowii TaxID=882446 RepID=A0ABS4QMQ6_9NOCA|nr:thiazole synthase [Nocardia goodfellowii]MBP2192985.1 thiazole synthase [Nocardia goodfellowii]